MSSPPRFEQRHRMQLALEHANVRPHQMASELEIHRNTVSNYLHGRTKPRRRDLIVWAQVCQVDLDWLVSGTVPDNKDYEDDETEPAGVLAKTHSYPYSELVAA